MGGIVGGALGGLVGGLFGSSQAPSQPRFNFFPDITTPSFRLRTGEGGIVDLTRTGSPQRFPNILADLAELRGEVRPGFGRFTEAAVESIRRAKGDALGNARQQLQRRRVAGSSFANAQLAGIESEFGRQENLFRGQALLQEIDATFKVIDEELKVKQANFQAEFLELGIAANVAGFVTQALSQQAIIDKAIAVKAAEGIGAFGLDIGEALGTGFFGSGESKEGSGGFFGDSFFGDLFSQGKIAQVAGSLFGGGGGGFGTPNDIGLI